MSTLSGVILAVGLLTLLRGLRFRSLVRRLGHVPQELPDSLASLTIIAAARDEEAGVERAVRSWMALDLPELQVVIINDRSRDRTGEILEGLAEEFPQLQFLTVRERPEGWLGKCHALSEGAKLAKGEFLLFTDADVQLEPEGMRRVLSHAQAEGADHLALLPTLHSENRVQEALTWLFFQVFVSATAGRGLNRDPGGCAIGVGAFNMVRRSAYEALGGHEPLRLQVGDDVALARMLVRAGCRQRVHWGTDIVSLQWQAGVLGTIRGLEKNAFWGFRFSLLALLLATAVGGLALVPVCAPFVGSVPALVGLAAWMVGVFLGYSGPVASFGQRLSAVALHPVSMLLLITCSWNSALATLIRGGISWRGDFFSTAELKAALKPLRWWLGPKQLDSGRPS